VAIKANFCSEIIQSERRGRVVKTPASYSEFPGSNLGPETGCPDLGFTWFS
jgi:hypothetical protein